MTLQDVMELANSNYSDLPQGWKWVELENVVDILDKHRKPINSTERQSRIEGKTSNQLYPYYGATGQVGYIDNYLLDGDFLLLGEDGAPFFEPFKNVAYLVHGKIWVNNHAHVLKAHVSNAYLCYFLNQVDYHNYVTGTTRLKLNQSSMRKILIKLPPPSEQHRIVEKIEELFSELDNGVASLKKALEQLKTYRQAVLKWAFEGKLTEKWRNTHQDSLEDGDTLLEQIKAERKRHYQQQLEDWKQALKEWENNGKETKKPTKPQQPKDLPPLTKEELSNLPSLPNGWMWVKLGYMTIGTEYGTSSKSQKEGKIPVLRMGNIQNGIIDWSDLVFTSNEDEIRQYLLQENDVLFNRTNSPELVGKTAIYSGKVPAIFAGYLIRINQINSIVNAKYLTYFLNSTIAKNHGNKVKTDGVNQSNINGEKLCNYPFPYISLQEQTQIVQEIESRLSVCDQLEATLTENLDKAEALRQSILKRAFEGKLVL
ncbi:MULTISPECIES: restriction endonuclease subunit S [unclassified Microcystis]|jgi:type I restriction enzyme S subunit|uniref:Restriction endonuclease subunit S n=1 Tax=Microcystis flos-aquae Mf_QC_C_20070823_S10D TaxID=2486236 RepID=A0A552KQY5_9CHRO|nr:MULTISPECIES: restriction endonuclease subunit S [unclassified Microcystis]MCA2815240.1 restriction endonuclease subunit S [Microcystis sp. M085S1]MCA2854458.1 restriction endonuclease subunit S [Microcystis sp. M065S1]TRT80426.1 MAG: restriction endonuclease subunit S [Microcystis flos-aquae Ma_QC_C_20070823_S18]TRU00973.1 MAG: restriction endonuclease subunit S [Microcystis flos-aquae Ma_QC_C_20070823_S18D]TRV10398.1 MAG: restriction endonuclease subunit S [Microcystis flos-aquae Mf_QC_C_